MYKLRHVLSTCSINLKLQLSSWLPAPLLHLLQPSSQFVVYHQRVPNLLISSRRQAVPCWSSIYTLSTPLGWFFNLSTLKLTSPSRITFSSNFIFPKHSLTYLLVAPWDPVDTYLHSHPSSYAVVKSYHALGLLLLHTLQASSSDFYFRHYTSSLSPRYHTSTLIFLIPSYSNLCLPQTLQISPSSGLSIRYHTSTPTFSRLCKLSSRPNLHTTNSTSSHFRSFY